MASERCKFTATKLLVSAVVLFFTVRGSDSFYPHTVKNHVVVNEDLLINRFLAQDWLSCIMSCQNDPECYSYNFEYKKSTGKGLCELYECGIDQEEDWTNLVYSHGFVFQQLKHHNEKVKSCVKKPSTRKGCRPKWIMKGNNCYLAVKEFEHWKNASYYCQAHGANLTSIHSTQENAIVSQIGKTEFMNYCENFLTGLIGWDGKSLVWSDGTKSFFQNFNVYNYWVSSHPVYVYTYMQTWNGKWIRCINYDSCRYPFVCKYILH